MRLLCSVQRAASEFEERVSIHVMDVTDREGVQRVVNEISNGYGPIEVAIHVAGIIQVGPAADVELEHFDQALDIMAKGPINMAWSVLPSMRERRRGRIGVVASVGGVVSPPICCHTPQPSSQPWASLTGWPLSWWALA